MNTPNKLTILRIILVPFFVTFLLIKEIPYNYIYAASVFIIASLTDLADGALSRRNNQITNFGKFLDPLADKILVTAALVCFVELKFASSVVVVIILVREFLVTSLRLVSADKGVVISANFWGKLKTAITMGVIIFVLVVNAFNQFISLEKYADIAFVSNILMIIVGVITVISGIEYIIKNIKHVDYKS
jgi:CDP-diacylglycerol--glycerol-3-phosphate 3-phosphatidyltransferase